MIIHIMIFWGVTLQHPAGVQVSAGSVRVHGRVGSTFPGLEPFGWVARSCKASLKLKAVYLGHDFKMSANRM